jgi:hypothetical protein
MKNCYRVRGEFTHIPKEERLRYLQAVLAISAQAQYKKRYEALLEIHRKYFRTPIHKAPNFLPWHRWFLLEYENLLREVIIASEFFYEIGLLSYLKVWLDRYGMFLIWPPGEGEIGGNLELIE